MAEASGLGLVVAHSSLDGHRLALHGPPLRSLLLAVYAAEWPPAAGLSWARSVATAGAAGRTCVLRYGPGTPDPSLPAFLAELCQTARHFARLIVVHGSDDGIGLAIAGALATALGVPLAGAAGAQWSAATWRHFLRALAVEGDPSPDDLLYTRERAYNVDHAQRHP